MTAKAQSEQTLTIAAPNFQTACFRIIGTAPYVQRQFSQKSQNIIRQKHEAGGTAGSRGKTRTRQDFDQDYIEAQHRADDGWTGIPAPALRSAMVSACRTAGFVMTRAKLAVFVEADGFDAADQTPLVRITKGEPRRYDAYGRDAKGGTQVMSRPMWREGWESIVRITFDADMLTLEDVANLLTRAGRQVGIGEGRPDSKKSAGCGWGTFTIGEEVEAS